MNYDKSIPWGRFVAPVFDELPEIRDFPLVRSLREIFILEFEHLQRRPFPANLDSKVLSLTPYPDSDYHKCIGPIFAKGIFVPCHSCFNCLRNRGLKLFNLFQLESTRSPDTFFLTLTYSDSCYETLNLRSVQLFLKRLRSYNYLFSYRLLAEHGPRHGRPHYHLLLFIRSGFVSYDVLLNNIQACWPIGLVDLKPAQKEHLYYIANYGKTLFVDAPTFTTSSKRPAIGRTTELYYDQLSSYAKQSSYETFEQVIITSRPPIDDLAMSFDYTDETIEQFKDAAISDLKTPPPPLSYELICNHFYKISQAYIKFIHSKMS